MVHKHMKRCSTSFMIKLHGDIIFRLSDGPHWQDQRGIGRDFPATVVVMQIGQLYSRRLGNIQLKGE